MFFGYEQHFVRLLIWTLVSAILLSPSLCVYMSPPGVYLALLLFSISTNNIDLVKSSVHFCVDDVVLTTPGPSPNAGSDTSVLPGGLSALGLVVNTCETKVWSAASLPKQR